MELLRGSAVFSKIDLLQGYHHIAMEERSMELTAFRTPDGVFCFKGFLLHPNYNNDRSAQQTEN